MLPTVNDTIAQAFLPKVSVNEVTGLIGEESSQQEEDTKVMKQLHDENKVFKDLGKKSIEYEYNG